MLKHICLCLGVLLPELTAAQDSNAARYLAAEALDAACQAGGAFRPGGLIERDLTGDGRDDLIIDHGGIRCEGEDAVSGYCGMQACTVLIYVREGGLLMPAVEMLAAGIEVDDANPPAISGYAHGGDPWSFRWTGERFE
ncbi:MAG: hypothetical protein ACRC6I_22265 [Paracoccaceae bacterium]